MLNGNPAAQIGIRGLYQGVKPCYFRDISFAAIYFGIYHEGRSVACLSLARARVHGDSLSLSPFLALSLSLSLWQACAGSGSE